jgi:hypothetical protein
MTRGFLACACLLLSAGLAGAPDPDLDGIWETAARLQFNPAARGFASEVERTGGREARLGRAVMLLSVQPKTEANTREARRLLESIEAEGVADDTEAAGLYALARLHQLHAAKPDVATAAAAYRHLISRHPAHPLGQLARLKLAGLEIFASAELSRAERLARAEGVLDSISDPGVRRDFHLMLASGYMRLGGREADALRHFLGAEATGRLARDSTRSSLYVQIAETAARLGQSPRAAAYYRRFLDEFPRDLRAGAVRERLTALEAEAVR